MVWTIGVLLVKAMLAVTGSPDEIAQKWVQRGTGAQQDYAQGVQRVTSSPGQAAARKADKYIAGVQENQEKWRQRVGAVSTEEWKQATVEKGAPRFAQGIQAAAPKVQAFLQEFLPFQERVTQEVKSMPDTNLEQRLQRMVAQARGTAQFRRGRGSIGGNY